MGLRGGFQDSGSISSDAHVSIFFFSCRGRSWGFLCKYQESLELLLIQLFHVIDDETKAQRVEDILPIIFLSHRKILD